MDYILHVSRCHDLDEGIINNTTGTVYAVTRHLFDFVAHRVIRLILLHFVTDRIVGQNFK